MADLLERERALLERLDPVAREELASALRSLVAPFDSEQTRGPEGRPAAAGSGRDETPVG